MSRGITNNNPGDIEVGGPVYVGEVQPPDGKFLRFIDAPHGLRAIIELLRAYQLNDGCKTWADMIERYAPPGENCTTTYITNTSGEIGIPTDGMELPDLWDNQTCDRVMKAITLQENGIQPYQQDIFDSAISLLGG